jgi:hypothetical protein
MLLWKPSSKICDLAPGISESAQMLFATNVCTMSNDKQFGQAQEPNKTLPRKNPDQFTKVFKHPRDNFERS